MPNVDIIEINQKLTDNAKRIASNMSNPQIRKRGMIDMLGISCAINYLQSKRLRIDTKRSVHKIPLLFEEFKISDIYLNNYRIDVITLYKEKTVKIPKIHFDVDVIPDFYFIVQIGAKIKEAKMIGFIEGRSVLNSSCDSKFYYPTLDLIFDLRKFITITKRSTPTRTILGKHADCMGLFLKFIDNDLSNVYKSQLIQHLMNCDSCRSRFIDTIEFEKIANNIRYYTDLMKKYEYKIQPISHPIVDEQTNSLEESLNKQDKTEEIYKEEQPQTEVIEYKEEIVNQNTEEDIEEPVSSKKVIDSIFKEMRNVELPQISTIIKSKYRHKIIAVFVIFVVLITLTIISVSSVLALRKENREIEQLQNESDEVSEFEMLYGLDEDNPSHVARKIPKQMDIESFDIQRPVQTQPTYSPNVLKIAWEAPEALVKKQNYTSFLQLAGKNIKLNLQNDLLLVRDVPLNRVVRVAVKVASNGDVKSVKIIQPSGSEAIDASINRVINDTLKYMKPPSHGLIARPADLSLTIELN